MNPSTARELTVLEAVEKRRSIKSFQTTPIPETLLQKIFNAILSAPSSWNFQPARIVVIQSESQKKALAEACWGQKQIIEAPVTFVFAASIRGWEEKMDKILEEAVQRGAWSQNRANYIRENAPAFQNQLGDSEREYAVKDAMISATHAALAAESLGLGSCFMNGWIEDNVKKVIGVEQDSDIAIALVMPIGYPAQQPKNPGRLPFNEIFFTDHLEA